MTEYGSRPAAKYRCHELTSTVQISPPDHIHAAEARVQATLRDAMPDGGLREPERHELLVGHDPILGLR